MRKFHKYNNVLPIFIGTYLKFFKKCLIKLCYNDIEVNRGDIMNYRYKIQNEAIDKLFEAVLKLENKEECYRFFDDLCTVNEIEAFGQRLQVAKMLYKKMTYQEIEKETGISAATISKISKSFSFGPGGYEMIIKRICDE